MGKVTSPVPTAVGQGSCIAMEGLQVGRGGPRPRETGTPPGRGSLSPEPSCLPAPVLPAAPRRDEEKGVSGATEFMW